MDAGSRDNAATTAAVGWLAYASADIVHHAFGHGLACLALGGRIVSLSSTFVQCTATGSAIDLAGPCANLLFGALALLAARMALRTSPATRLFLILAAAFNLLWFALQLASSAATRTDDWAWAMHEFHVGEPARYGMVAAGVLGYVLAIRATAFLMVPFAQPPARGWRIVLTAWLTAGAMACITAAFHQDPVATVLKHALPQSLALSAGLLFVPARAAKSPSSMEPAPPLAMSIPWTIAAAVVAAASIVLLGPGFALAI